MRLAVVLHDFEGGGHDVHGCQEAAAKTNCILTLDAPELQAHSRQLQGIELPGLLVQRESKLFHVVAVDQPGDALNPDKAEQIRARKGSLA